MNKDFLKLENEFKKIRKMGLIESKRKGTSGLGYTFECLLNKKEDQECKPDYGTIEIKCKLGYTKTPITLFNCAPIRNGVYATRYILDNYGYEYNNNRIFSRTLFVKYTRVANNYNFKLKINYLEKRIIMEAYYNNKFLEEVCYWDFKELEKKLKVKLTNLAIIYGYPYNYNNIIYYKYLKFEAYKLKGFYEFLDFINRDIIRIQFYMKEGKSILGNPEMDTHGVAFKINRKDINKLFYRIF